MENLSKILETFNKNKSIIMQYQCYSSNENAIIYLDPESKDAEEKEQILLETLGKTDDINTLVSIFGTDLIASGMHSWLEKIANDARFDKIRKINVFGEIFEMPTIHDAILIYFMISHIVNRPYSDRIYENCKDGIKKCIEYIISSTSERKDLICNSLLENNEQSYGFEYNSRLYDEINGFIIEKCF